jgi:hypothetical protein
MVEYFAITSLAMFLQQTAMYSKKYRDLIGLPPNWPNMSPTPAKTGTHPLARFLSFGGSGADGDSPKVVDSYVSMLGPQQPTPPGPPPGSPPEEIRAAFARAVPHASASASAPAAVATPTASTAPAAASTSTPTPTPTPAPAKVQPPQQQPPQAHVQQQAPAQPAGFRVTKAAVKKSAKHRK